MSSNNGATAAQSPPRGLRKRLIAFFTVLMMALGFGGFSALPALASSTEADSGSEPDSSSESLEEEDEEEDDEDAVEEDAAAVEDEEDDDAAAESESQESESASEEQEAAEEPAAQQELETVEEPAAGETELTEETSAEEPAAEEAAQPDEAESDEATTFDETETVEESGSTEEEAVDEVIEVELMAASDEEDEEDDQELLEPLEDENSVEVLLSEEELSEADARHWGIDVEVHGLASDADVEILLNGESVASGLDVRWGVASYTHQDPLSAGVHTFTVLTGGETYNASVTVTPGGYEPVVEISEDEISERDAWYFGISIYGTGAEPGAEAQILLNGEAIATVTVDEFEAFLFEHHEPLSAGEHTFTVVVSGESFAFPVSVIDGGYDPFVHLSMGGHNGEHVIAEWDVSREGFAVTGEDFEPGSTVTASVAGTQVGTGTADENGVVHIEEIVLELPVGPHTLTLTSDKVTGSVDFSVLADDDYYDLDGQDSDDLEAVTSIRVATETELAAGELWTRSYAFPHSDFLDLYINGALEAHGIDGTEQYVLTGLEPGSYTATWVFGELSASVDFTVVPDEQGTPAPQGSYEGTAQTSGDTSVPLTFQIDENGVLTEFSSERWFQCVGYQGIPTDPFDFDWSVPATPITVDQPFEIRWDSYVISGIVNSDGSASGEAEWRIPCWGAIHDHWTAQADVVIPEPEPTPEPTPDPTAEPTPTDEPTPDPTADPTPTDEPTSEPTTTPTSDPTADPTDEPTTEPTPTQEPTSDPTTGPGDSDDQSGISAPSTAVAGAEITITVGDSYAGEEVTVWLYSDPVLLGTPTVSQAGTVEVALPAGVTGEHTLEVTDADGALIGTSEITITAASDGTGTDGSDSDDTGADGAGSSGSDDQDPASTDDASDIGDDSGAASSGDDTESGSPGEDGAGDGSTDAASSGSATDGGSGEGESAADGLAATGTTVALVAIGAGVLMLLGVAVLSLSRRRSAQTVK